MIKRYLQMMRLCTIKSPMKRAEYMKMKGVFHEMGNRVMITSRKIPLYSKLISIGNNVWIASGVEFVPHDVTHYMLNGMSDGHKYTEKIGCIEIGDNVIIAAGALVNRDVPDNSVVGGVPARVIMSFDEYTSKRREFTVEHIPNNAKQEISSSCEKEMWHRFNKSKSNTIC